MKKLILTVLILSLAIPAFAAGTIGLTYEESDKRGQHWIQVTAVCTADSADNSYPDTLIEKDVSGLWLVRIRTFFDSVTPPTDNSDLYLRENTASTGYDVLGGAGANTIDIATDNDFKGSISGAAHDIPIFGPVYIEIENNAVASAITRIVFDFVQK